MYKTVAVIYFICFSCYVLFSRVPDYFDGELTQGVVTEATYSVKDKHPIVVVNYKIGNEKFKYITNMWFLTSYKPGQKVPIIYNPSNPRVASIYAFIGYWIKWSELFLTAIVFIILFIAAIFITGKNNSSPAIEDGNNRKRKYND